MSCRITRGTIEIDGKPRIPIAGEIHYYRLDRSDWAHRLDAAASAGFTAIASYIPWLVHEQADGSFDLDGHAHAENDLGGFIDMVAERNMLFIARPGPYVMAEMKNEGIPYRLWEIPEIVPLGWDGGDSPVPTLDLANPLFLAQARVWYEALGRVLAPRMADVGGPIIMVQLDNEIGMLDWVSNTPCLTENLISGFVEWLTAEHGDRLSEHYPAADLADPNLRITAIRSPTQGATQLRIDLCRFMRDRFSDYIDTLAEYAREFGFGGQPFLINIHGSGGGYAERFPIGISQLWKTYAGKAGFTSGSDIYLGQPNLRNFAELHMINAMMESVHDDDQAVTSLEFEVGTGDYGQALEIVQDPSSTDLKARLCVAQNHKLFNFYLLTGGRNRIEDPPRPAHSRIATTGERHGAAAPIDPEGELTSAWDPTVASVRAISANEQWLASAREERDNIALGWCPDYYLTEYRYPGAQTPDADGGLVADLESNRGGGPRHALPRFMLYNGYRYGAINLQEAGWSRRPNRPDVLAFAAASQMDPQWQAELVSFVEAGGGLFLYGSIPTKDMVGNQCTILADALGIKAKEIIWDSHGDWTSARPLGWAAPEEQHPRRAEVRVGFARTWDPGPNDVLVELVPNGAALALDARLGAGRVITLTGDYPTDLEFASQAFELLGARRGLSHEGGHPGLVMTTTTDGHSRLLHILNITGYSNTVTVEVSGTVAFGGAALEIGPYDAMMLPIGAQLAEGLPSIQWSTAELAGVNVRSGAADVTLRTTQSIDRIQFSGSVGVQSGDHSGITVTETSIGTLVTINRQSGPVLSRDIGSRHSSGCDLVRLTLTGN